jgi:RNA polymerase sigma factor (sigma-70 family)
MVLRVQDSRNEPVLVSHGLPTRFDSWLSKCSYRVRYQPDNETVGERVPVDFEKSDVQRAAEGDHAAFERLYRDHVGRIYSLCARMVDEQSAEDLTQEVFIRAWRKLDLFKGQSQFGTWLHRLAVNHVLSRRETQRKRESRNAGGDGLLARVTAPSRRSSGHAIDIESAIGRLPNRKGTVTTRSPPRSACPSALRNHSCTEPACSCGNIWTE